MGTSINEAKHVAIARQCTPSELPRHLKLNAMTYGEWYGAFHDLIEALFGADEDEAFDNTYASLEVGHVGSERQDGKGKKCFNCGKLGHVAKDCRSTGTVKGNLKGGYKRDGKGAKGGGQWRKGDGKGKNQKDVKRFGFSVARSGRERRIRRPPRAEVLESDSVPRAR